MAARRHNHEGGQGREQGGREHMPALPLRGHPQAAQRGGSPRGDVQCPGCQLTWESPSGKAVRLRSELSGGSTPNIAIGGPGGPSGVSNGSGANTTQPGVAVGGREGEDPAACQVTAESPPPSQGVGQR